jgi:hypothetical protein
MQLTPDLKTHNHRIRPTPLQLHKLAVYKGDTYTGQLSSKNSNATTRPEPLQFPHNTPPNRGSPAATIIAFGGGRAEYPSGMTLTYSLDLTCKLLRLQSDGQRDGHKFRMEIHCMS